MEKHPKPFSLDYQRSNSALSCSSIFCCCKCCKKLLSSSLLKIRIFSSINKLVFAFTEYQTGFIKSENGKGGVQPKKSDVLFLFFRVWWTDNLSYDHRCTQGRKGRVGRSAIMYSLENFPKKFIKKWNHTQCKWLYFLTLMLRNKLLNTLGSPSPGLWSSVHQCLQPVISSLQVAENTWKVEWAR